MTKIGPEQKAKLYFIALVILSLSAATFIAFCIRYAPWGFSDSAAYFSAARNLAKGIGLGFVNVSGTFTPLILQPPLFPIVLSFFVKIGVDLIVACRWVDIFLFFSLVFTSGWLFFRINDSSIAAFLFAFSIATCSVITYCFSGLMSEPLAYATGIPCMLLLLLSIKKQSRVFLIIAGILSGLSFLSRYAFAAIPITGILIIILLSRSKFIKRLLDILIFTILSLSPYLIWVLSEGLKKSLVGSRHIILKIDLVSKLTAYILSSFKEMKYWLPYRTGMIPRASANWFSPVLAICLVLLVGAGIFFMIKDRRSENQQVLVLSFSGSLIFIFAYFLVIFASYAFTAESIPINQRLLSPLLIGIFGVLFSCALAINRGSSGKPHIPIIGIIIGLFFGMYNLPLLQIQLASYQYPEGYTAVYWNNPVVHSAIEALPQGKPILSNAPDVILFYTNRSAYFLTTLSKSSGDKVSINDKNLLNTLVSQQCGALVLFDAGKATQVENKEYLIDQKTVNDLELAYPPVFQSVDGNILMDPKCISK